MKKKLIILYPFPFSKFNFFQFSFDLLKKKNVKVEIHNLSDLFISKKFQDVWKLEEYKLQSIKFKNIFSWFFYIIKEPPNTFILNCTNQNINSINFFIIKIILSLKGFKVFIYDVIDIINIKPKKNFNFFYQKVFKQYKFDLFFYFNFIKKFIFYYLDKIHEFKNEIILTNTIKKNQNDLSNKIIRNIHSFDYSNFLRSVNKIKKNKYFVYLDAGYPYFAGDYYLDRSKNFNFNEILIKEYIKRLNHFFHFIEKKFKKKVLVVPHPKFRLINKKKNFSFFNNFSNFKNFNKIDTNDAVREAYCVLINTDTTSLSFAILNYKPIIFLDSEMTRYSRTINHNLNLKKMLTLLKIRSFDLNQAHLINKQDITFNKIVYDKYKFLFLQNPNLKISNKNNAELIYELLQEKSTIKKM